MNKQQLIQAAVAATHISRLALTEKKRAVAELNKVMDAGDQGKAIYDGEDFGTVSVTNGRPRYVVTDPDALVEWLEWNKPEAVKKVPAPWFTATAALDGFIKQTGEVPDGVEVETPAPTVRVSISSKQEEVLRELIAEGAVKVLEGGVKADDGAE